MARSNVKLYAISGVITLALLIAGGIVIALIVAATAPADPAAPPADVAAAPPPADPPPAAVPTDPTAAAATPATAAEVKPAVGAPAVTPTVVWSEHGSDPSAPAWSAGGRLIAFEVPRAFGTVKLYAAEVQEDGRAFASPLAPDGTSAKQRFRLMQQPVWFGSEVLFEGQVERSAVRRVFRAPPNGGAAFEIFDAGAVEGTLADVAVDTTAIGRIAFVNHTLQEGELYLWDSRVGKAKALDPQPGLEHTPVFSADGASLVFSREIAGDDDLYKLDLRKGTSVLLAGGPGEQVRPTVLPDGRVLFFNSADGRTWDIAITNGTEVRTIAATVKLPTRSGPNITTDGQWLAWIGTEKDTNRLRFTSMADGRLVEVEALGVKNVDEIRVVQKDGLVRVAFVAGPAGDRNLYAADVTEFLLPAPAPAASAP